MKDILYQMKRPYWYIQKHGFKAFVKAIFRKFFDYDKTKREIKRRDQKANLRFLEKLTPTLEKMPESNGSRYYNKMNIKIGIIADQFLFDAYKGCAEFLYITPDNYRNYVDEVEFLWVVSAWRGLHQEWSHMADEGSQTNKAIHKAIQYYREHGKRVVFYSKEDPPNYEHFLAIAKKCDVIFTSCVEKVEDYKRDCNTDEVYVLEFCINPVFHNPIGMKNPYKKDGVFFAGSWMIKYPERVKIMEQMLDGVIDARKPLVIADRNYSMNKLSYFFPRKYYSYLVKEIPHDMLQKVHKLYDWAININSITDSKTMFANRVYELQANGCLMISNASIGVEEKFKNIYIVKSQEDVPKILSSLSKQDVFKKQIEGIRNVMTGETCYDRICYVLHKLGIQCETPNRSVLVVADDCGKVQKQFEAQTYQNKVLVSAENLTQEQFASYDVVTYWMEENTYYPYYLEDMINGFKYSDSSFITMGEKKTEYDYVQLVKDIYHTVFWREDISYDAFAKKSFEYFEREGFAIHKKDVFAVDRK